MPAATRVTFPALVARAKPYISLGRGPSSRHLARESGNNAAYVVLHCNPTLTGDAKIQPFRTGRSDIAVRLLVRRGSGVVELRRSARDARVVGSRACHSDSQCGTTGIRGLGI